MDRTQTIHIEIMCEVNREDIVKGSQAKISGAQRGLGGKNPLWRAKFFSTYLNRSYY
jgi:hypothetical protein